MALMLASGVLHGIMTDMLSAIFWYWRRRLHLSFCIAYACVGIVFGVGLAQYSTPGFFMGIGWAALGCILILIAVICRRYWVVLLLLSGGLCFGLWRGSFVVADISQYQPFYGTEVGMRAIVAEDPDTDASGMTVLKLGHVSVGDRPLAGTLWISEASKSEIKRSDHVSIYGKLSPGFGAYAGVMYRASVIGVSREDGSDIARDFRDWFASKVRLAIREPQSSLGVGYLIGQKSALPDDLNQALVVAGLTHVVVASGYNLTILVRLARRLFSKISKYASALAAGGMIVAFMCVTGLSPSMSRAGLVAGLSLLAWYCGRVIHPLVLLPLAMAVTLLANPSYASGDLGWVLSFSSFAGVMIIAPLLQSYFFGESKPKVIRQILGETVAAQCATLPILILAFGQFSNVSLITNILILPLVPLAMLLTFFAGIGAIFLPAFAPFIGLPAQWLLTYMTSVTTYFAGLPWATTKLAIGPLIVVISYIVIAAACMYLRAVTKTSLENDSLIV